MRNYKVLAMLTLVVASVVWGQVPIAQVTQDKTASEQPAASNSTTNEHELTAVDVEAFLAGIFPQQIERENIAGATVSVVKDGKLLFSHGYGYSDVSKKMPVLPDKTLFRPGSISKLCTWTAVMQLQEQGKLDLDADVNQYLDFKIPDAFGKPITLKDIMTHTPGFEEQVKDLFSVGNTSPDLGAYLKTHVPARIYPPGTTPAYSNYATALAGYIVERVSGRPFSDYIAENIFKPLGMADSTFFRPLPSDLAPNMSNGYRLGSDETPVPFEVVVPFPAGSLSSTANDMAKFILAHLQDGQFGEARILKPETAKLMHSRLFALDPAANAMAYGFYEESRNGHRIIGHAGDTIAFHSDLHLIPDAGVGFFVSYNSAGKGEISPRTLIWEAFLDRYFPYTPPAAPTLEGAKADAAAVSGNYMLSRRSENSFLRVASILGEAKVEAREDGTIVIASLTEPSGQPKRWREVAPMTFQDVNGQDKLIFKNDANGNMQLILPFPFMVFQRVGSWDNSSVMLPVLAISLLIMLLTLIMTPIAWLVRRHYGQKLVLAPLERKLRYGVLAVFGLDLLFVVSFVALITYAMSHIEILSDAGNKWFYSVQAIGVVGAFGTFIVIFNSIKTWMGSRGIWSKLFSLVMILVCLGYLWFAFAGNLLVFRSNY